MIAVTLALQLLLMTCVGIFTAKIKLVSSNFASQLTSFLMKVAIPCLIYVSITAKPFSLEALKSCSFALIAGFITIPLCLLIGHIVFLLTGKSGFGRVVRYALTFSHFSFMGIPVVDALFGATGNLYYVMFLVPVRIFYYSLTPRLFGVPEKAEKTWKDRLSFLLNPCLIAVVIGLIAWVTGFQFPDIIQYCIKGLNSICSPLGLVLCGLVIGSYDLKKLLNIRYLRGPVMKTVLLPLIFFGLTRIPMAFGVDPILCNMIVIYSALPCASLTAAYAVQYEPDPEIHFEAAGIVFFATLMSAITVPIWFNILS